MNQNWNVGKVKEELPDDDLLSCLVLLSIYHNYPMSAVALIAGLPLRDGRLVASKFPLAAERANLYAEVKKRKLDEISELSLPAVLLLENKNACILLKVNDHEAEIVLPQNQGIVSKISLQDLKEKYSGHMILVREKHESAKEEQQSKSSSQTWFWAVLRKAMPLYGEIILASLLINLFALVVPLFVMNVYNRVIPNNAVETLWVLTSGVLIVFAFDFVLKMLRSYFIDNASKATDIKISSNLFSQALGIKMNDRPGSVGAFANSIQSFDLFRDFITSTTITVLVDIPFFFLFVAVLFMIGGSIGFIPLVLTPLVLIVGFFSQASMIKLTKQTYAYNAERQSVLYESLGGAETLKSMCAEGLMQDRWERAVGLAANLGTKLRFLTNLGMNFSSFVQQLITILIVIVGVYLIAQNELTTGGLVACVIIGSRSLTPVIQVTLILTKYIQARNAIHNIDEIMKMPIERPIDKKPLHLPSFKGEIIFDNVSFSYDLEMPVTLKDVSFKIAPGEKVGIIGRLGSGKSTIAKLILGLYQASEGSVLLDGIEVNQLDPADIRLNMGYVPQETKLFNATIRDNIIMRSPAVDDETLLHAVEISGVGRFTKTHPKGLDCEVGENGQSLSGGQCQAIAIARALVGLPEVYVFDEPTNSMDDNSSLHFLQNFRKHFNDKTMILITHQASVLQFIDRLIVLEQGKVVADGPRGKVLESLSLKAKSA